MRNHYVGKYHIKKITYGKEKISFLKEYKFIK